MCVYMCMRMHMCKKEWNVYVDMSSPNDVDGEWGCVYV